MILLAQRLRNWAQRVVARPALADRVGWGPLLAGALIASIPVAVLYTFFIDHFVAGLTAVAGE